MLDDPLVSHGKLPLLLGSWALQEFRRFTKTAGSDFGRFLIGDQTVDGLVDFDGCLVITKRLKKIDHQVI